MLLSVRSLDMTRWEGTPETRRCAAAGNLFIIIIFPSHLLFPLWPADPPPHEMLYLSLRTIVLHHQWKTWMGHVTNVV